MKIQIDFKSELLSIMDAQRVYSRNDDRNEDVPVYSRLFIVCDRNLTEDDLRNAFHEYGDIEDIRFPCDRNTGERKGIAYIKFAKTSQAAFALEDMNNKIISTSNRRLKVIVAANRSDIHVEDDSKYKRLFLNISKNATEDELYEYFKQYGNVDDILILSDRKTGEKKGFAYVKFRKFSEAATAFEQCDKKYRAIFAQPQRNQRIETTFETNINTLALSPVNNNNLLVSMMNVHPQGFTRVSYMCNPYLTQPLIASLFNIIPGMVDCRYIVDLVKNIGKGSVQYTNTVSAAYAVEKINEFEYPPGCKIFVKAANSVKINNVHHSIPRAVANLRNVIDTTYNSSSPDLAQLAEAIVEASKLIKVATAGVIGDNVPDSNDLNYCSVRLPSTQPLADVDKPIAKRCFLVCKPQPPPLTVLRDIFCRFGNLVNVYTLPNKVVGYARYATVESADQAIKTLHGAEICGVRVKVLEADEEAPPKRMRYDN